MPNAAPKPCLHPLCKKLVHFSERYCETHRKQVHKQVDERRGSAHSRGYTGEWKRAREAYLRDNPLCVHCRADHCITPATVVDHVVPHKGNMRLFWDQNNWQALCKMHHDRKTATEDGGFGRVAGPRRTPGAG